MKHLSRLLASAAVLLTTLALTAPAANAGYYETQVCRGGHGNSALGFHGPGPTYDWAFRVSNNCDGSLGGANGISVSVTNGPDNPATDPWIPGGTSAGILASAPAGTGIERLWVDQGRLGSFLSGYTGFSPRVMSPSLGWCRTDGEGGSLCAQGWQRPASPVSVSWWDAAYQTYGGEIGPVTAAFPDLTVSVVCAGGSKGLDGRPCYRWRYASSAGVSIVSAAIKVRDNTKPTISPISGDLAAGGWRKPGTFGFGVTGWDNTGIRAFTKFVNGADVGTIDQPCNYGLMKPCEDRAITNAVTVGGDYDGGHTVVLRAWSAANAELDCAVDCADSAVHVHTDGTAPDAPATYNPGPAWSKTNAFGLRAPTPASEIDPDGAGPRAQSPIRKRIVTVCPETRATPETCKSSEATPAVAGEPASAQIAAPGEGAWQARIELVDEVGNRSQSSAPVAVRFDQTPPTLIAEQIHKGVKITGVDALSGTATFSYRIDEKGDWTTVEARTLNGKRVVELPLPSGQRIVEVKATDTAGNTSHEAQRFELTIPDDAGSGLAPDPFGGAESQIAVVDRGDVNGAGGSESATLTSWFVKRSKAAKAKRPTNLSTRTMGTSDSATIEGLLVDAGGKGIAGARIDLGASIAGGRNEIRRGAATTNSDGNFTIKLRKGQTSRKLTIAYVARVNDLKPVATAGLELVVKARSTFKVHNPRVGLVRFSGTVSSGYLTKAGTRVEVQWFNKATRKFDTFDTVRTDQKGRWRSKRVFTQRASYRMRAFVPSSPAYAYKGALSRTKLVRIR